MKAQEDRKTRMQRRAEREPWAIEQLRLFMQAASREEERRRLRKRLIHARWSFHEELSEARALAKMKRGSVVAKKQALWPLAQVCSGDVHQGTCVALSQCLVLVGKAFEDKWSGAEQDRRAIMDCLFAQRIAFIQEETVAAVLACKRKARRDHFGLCSAILEMDVLIHVTKWADFLSELAN
jgi:hypothetical protein